MGQEARSDACADHHGNWSTASASANGSGSRAVGQPCPRAPRPRRRHRQARQQGLPCHMPGSPEAPPGGHTGSETQA